MWRVCLLALAAVLFDAGCDGSEMASTQPEEANSESKKVPMPDFTRQSDLALINGWKALHVGEKEKIAEDFFERPDRASDLRDVPPGMEGIYRSRGWQTTNEGFGLLFYGDRLALAMRYFEQKDDEFFESLLKRLLRRFPNLTALRQNAKKVRYWFLESGNDRLMLCAVNTPSGDVSIAVSIGKANVMDYLEMNARFARQAAELIEPMLPAAPSNNDGAVQNP